MKQRALRIQHGVSALAVMASLAVAARGFADGAAGRYCIGAAGTGMGTVEDTKTGLVWQQTPATMLDWSDAKDSCANKNTGGQQGAGWRLPSVKELSTLVDESFSVLSVPSAAAVDPTAFPGTEGAYWTSNAPANVTMAYYVNLNDGYTGTFATSTLASVRCVRALP